jgi:hypothetical protein
MNKIWVWVKEAMVLKALVFNYPKDSQGYEKINAQYA